MHILKHVTFRSMKVSYSHLYRAHIMTGHLPLPYENSANCTNPNLEHRNVFPAAQILRRYSTYPFTT